MHTIQLKIQDSVFEKVIYFLNNLPKNEVEIVEEKFVLKSKKRKFDAISIDTRNFKFDREEANAR
jgi:hypothetical protein